MKLLLLLATLLLTANADQLDTKYLGKTVRINAIESSFNQFQETQSDINLYQSALNSNQTELNTELKEQIKALELRLNKLERKQYGHPKINP